MDLSTLDPALVWKHFSRICAIPHPSHGEGPLAARLVAWAKDHGLEVHRDPSDNLVIRKPASLGHEGAPGLILQAHLDMVPQARSGVAHDFSKDPILPRISPKDPAWLVATDTTLGADNGIGVAMALAILEDPDLIHGPLECLFTTNEEDGMSGARAVAPGQLQGRLLLNLDGEDEKEITIGCAGSIRTQATLTRSAEAVGGKESWYRVRVGGLLGGHSGVDIDQGRANASLVLARVLQACEGGFSLAQIEGGTASNAIPREAWALVGLSQARADFPEALQAAFRGLGLEATEPKAELKVDAWAGQGPSLALGPVATAEALDLLASLPNGLVRMEPDMPGLVRTSLNLGKLVGHLVGKDFVLTSLVMIRSSSEEEKEDLGRRVEAIIGGAATKGWKVVQERPSVTPAWQPDPESPLLEKARRTFAKRWGREPRVTATHGGLECGLFRPAFPDWDMISLGPTIRHPHSPDEALELASVPRVYAFLKELIRTLA